jgi:hypothetical protein
MKLALFGDIRDFGLGFSFYEDPDVRQGATPEQVASWGGFEIWVGGKNLCIHSSTESLDSDYTGTFDSQCHWYLLALIEWFAYNFVIITSGDISNLPTQIKWKRHNIQASREGGIFPNLQIWNHKGRVKLSWGKINLPGLPDYVQFMNVRGTIHLDPKLVKRSLLEALKFASDYFLTQLPDSERFKKLKVKVDNLWYYNKDIK